MAGGNIFFRFSSNYNTLDNAGDFDLENEIDNESVDAAAIYQELKSTGEVKGKSIMFYSPTNGICYSYKISNVTVHYDTNTSELKCILDLELDYSAEFGGAIQ